jgi:single-strand DNA-binding protein
MMNNEAHISLSGYVATQPALRWTRTGVPALNMRVAWTPRRLDRVTGEWVDMDTSFLTVCAYRKLAENAATCLRKGDPIVLRGRVSTRDFEDKDGHPRTALEVDAISFGHDLTRGVATFQRVRPQTGLTASEYQEAENGTRESQPAEASSDGPSMADLGQAADDAAFASLVVAAGAGRTRPGGRRAGASGGAKGDEGREPLAADAAGELTPEAAGAAVPF